MKSVQFSERENMWEWGLGSGGVQGRTVNVFGPYFGGGMPMSRPETRKRHLSLQLLRRGDGRGFYCKNDWSSFQTSAMTNMNITYKMPHVSTKIYSYLSSTYVCTVEKWRENWFEGGRKARSWTIGCILCRTEHRKKIKRQQPEAGHFFFSLARNLIEKQF